MSIFFLMKDRRLPTYSDMELQYLNQYGPSFEFDYKSPSRGKYRQSDGIRAYASGYVEVQPHVHRSPDMRHKMFVRYGLTFCIPKECSWVKFFTPDNAPVAASAITTDMLFLDRQTRQAYSYEHKLGKTTDSLRIKETARIDFATPGAVPMAHAQVYVDIPNMERVKAVLREYKEFFKACATTSLLMQGTHIDVLARSDDSGHVHAVLEMMLRGEEVDLAVVQLHTQVRIGEYVTGQAEIGIRGKLTSLSTKNFAFPYLKIVWEDNNG